MEKVQNFFRLPALRINLLLSPPVLMETEDRRFLRSSLTYLTTCAVSFPEARHQDKFFSCAPSPY